MLYQKEVQGDWGQMQGSDTITVATETLAMGDGCKLFLRSWVTSSRDILLILHGMGGHSSWYIDIGNALAQALRGFSEPLEKLEGLSAIRPR